MAISGGKPDAQGYAILSHRIVTDADATAGLGDALDPLRVDPTGTTVQPVSFSSPQHVIVDSGGGSNASVGTTGSAVPASATLVGATKSGNLTALALDASGNLNATIATALPAGTAVIGHVISDSGSVTTATLAAETTKVIGTTRSADGAGNLLTSNSTTPAAKFALDSNITSILGTAPSAAGKLDVKSAAGDLNCTLVAETTKVIGTTRTLGNTGATLDSTAAAGTAPTNALLTSIIANTAAPTPTNGQAIAQQGDPAGNLRVNPTGNVGSFASKVDNHAASANALLTVPAGKKWIVESANFVLTTSSTVATRVMNVVVKDASGNIIYAFPSTPTQAASLVVRYCFGPGMPTAAAVVAGTVSAPMPELVLGPSFTLASSVSAIATGDQILLVANVIELND
jgi:hypothetical protein